MIFGIISILTVAAAIADFEIPALKERPIPKLWEQPEFPAELKSFFNH